MTLKASGFFGFTASAAVPLLMSTMGSRQLAAGYAVVITQAERSIAAAGCFQFPLKSRSYFQVAQIIRASLLASATVGKRSENSAVDRAL